MDITPTITPIYSLVKQNLKSLSAQASAAEKNLTGKSYRAGTSTSAARVLRSRAVFFQSFAPERIKHSYFVIFETCLPSHAWTPQKQAGRSFCTAIRKLRKKSRTRKARIVYGHCTQGGCEVSIVFSIVVVSIVSSSNTI